MATIREKRILVDDNIISKWLTIDYKIELCHVFYTCNVPIYRSNDVKDR